MSVDLWPYLDELRRQYMERGDPLPPDSELIDQLHALFRERGLFPAPGAVPVPAEAQRWIPLDILPPAGCPGCGAAVRVVPAHGACPVLCSRCGKERPWGRIDLRSGAVLCGPCLAAIDRAEAGLSAYARTLDGAAGVGSVPDPIRHADTSVARRMAAGLAALRAGGEDRGDSQEAHPDGGGR